MTTPYLVSGAAAVALFETFSNSTVDIKTFDKVISWKRYTTSLGAAVVVVPVVSGLSFALKASSLFFTLFGDVKPLRLLFAHASGDVRENHAHDRAVYKEKLLHRRGGADQSYDVDLRHEYGTVHGVFSRSRHSYGQRRVCLLIGGSNASLEDLDEEAKFLLKNGIDVFAFQNSGYAAPQETYGYHESEGQVESLFRRASNTIDELSVTTDGTAIVHWLTSGLPTHSGGVRCDMKYRKDELMIEAHSLGTLTAHMILRKHPDLAAAVMVEPLTNIAEVAGYVALNNTCDLLENWLPRSTLHRLLYGPVMRLGEFVSWIAWRPPLFSRHLPPDAYGFDARGAVAGFKGHYCVIEAGKDELMSIKSNRDFFIFGSRNFAKELIGIAKKRRMSKHRSRIIFAPTAEHGHASSSVGVRSNYAGFLANIGFANYT